mgnify:FL=1
MIYLIIMKRTTIISIVAIILVIGGIIWIARSDSQNSAASLITNSNGIIITEEANYDFGVISMANGKVNHQFKIENTSNEKVIINKVYTSCMCTTASVFDEFGNKLGVFGMPGHDGSSKADIEISGRKTFIVEAVFDPAAHGPSGVGLAKRSIYIETNSEKMPELEFSIQAMVTK